MKKTALRGFCCVVVSFGGLVRKKVLGAFSGLLGGILALCGCCLDYCTERKCKKVHYILQIKKKAVYLCTERETKSLSRVL